MNTFGNSVGTIIGMLGILAAIGTPIWISRRRHGLRWASLSPRSMLDVAEEIASDISISFKDNEIDNLTQYQFILHNSGYVALKGSAIVKPMEWTCPGRILSFRVVGTDPPVDIRLKEVVVTHPSGELEPKEKKYRLQITWPLLNQRCKALIEVLCEGNPSEPLGRIKGQIENVPRIKEKQIHDDNRRTQTIVVAVVGGTLIFGLFFGLLLFKDSLALPDMDSWFFALMPLISGCVIGAILSVAKSLAQNFGNPYARFITKARTSDPHLTRARS